MLQKSLYLTRNIPFIIFLQDVKLFQRYVECYGGGERRFLNSYNFGVRRETGLKIDVFVGCLLWMTPYSGTSVSL